MKLGKKLLIIFAVIILLFVFPQRVAADSGPPVTRRVYYYEFDEKGLEHFVSYRLIFYGNISAEQQALAVYTNLFENFVKETIPFVPDETRLIGLKITEGTLVLNVSGKVKGYGGGSAYEQGLIGQILKNAEQFAEVERITLLIDGRRETLPEGTLLLEAAVRPVDADSEAGVRPKSRSRLTELYVSDV